MAFMAPPPVFWCVVLKRLSGALLRQEKFIENLRKTEQRF
jgi:hypothetical protein